MVGCIKYLGEEKWNINKFKNHLNQKNVQNVLHLRLLVVYILFIVSNIDNLLIFPSKILRGNQRFL